MLLTGSFARTLDEKLRVGLPKSLRDEWDPGTDVGYLGPGTDGSLALYAPSVFSQLARELGAVSATGADVRAFGRLFYAQVQRVDFDPQGRLRLPTELARWAKLDKEVMLLGVRDHVEIWDRATWERYLAAQQTRYDEIADAAFRASVARRPDVPPTTPPTMPPTAN